MSWRGRKAFPENAEGLGCSANLGVVGRRQVPRPIPGFQPEGRLARLNPRATPRQVLITGACVCLSILGLLLHNAREFGASALADASTGTIPYGLLQLSLFVAWILSSQLRPALEIALVLTAAIQLLGGGVVSVLPLSFLPFEPEQSFDHYISHVILAFLQLPLLIYPLRLRSRRKPHTTP